ncbi:hypothetical protein [Francisella frigiditurris]|uniref:Uncharacterized protein n=1 Tax=Francisella frigiditurris TaxID=1542390 RepID=A0A1J0KSB5_9GAMM|nr:hypothetical protein [Francisella frigiditurris]APC96516.1 hypothetical protein KX01_1234 [Francisella frigiditurris]
MKQIIKLFLILILCQQVSFASLNNMEQKKTLRKDFFNNISHIYYDDKKTDNGFDGFKVDIYNLYICDKDNFCYKHNISSGVPTVITINTVNTSNMHEITAKLSYDELKKIYFTGNLNTVKLISSKYIQDLPPIALLTSNNGEIEGIEITTKQSKDYSYTYSSVFTEDLEKTKKWALLLN